METASFCISVLMTMLGLVILAASSAARSTDPHSSPLPWKLQEKVHTGEDAIPEIPHSETAGLTQNEFEEEILQLLLELTPSPDQESHTSEEMYRDQGAIQRSTSKMYIACTAS